MESAFLQLESIQNLHITFEVDFIHICDLARCCIHFVKVAMNENDFNKGLGKYLADDYYKVGIMISIALLQNGRLPKFVPPNVIQSLVRKTENPCIAKLFKSFQSSYTCMVAHRSHRIFKINIYIKNPKIYL